MLTATKEDDNDFERGMVVVGLKIRTQSHKTPCRRLGSEEKGRQVGHHRTATPTQISTAYKRGLHISRTAWPGVTREPGFLSISLLTTCATCLHCCCGTFEEPISQAGCTETEVTGVTEATIYGALIVHKVPGCQGRSGSVRAL